MFTSRRSSGMASFSFSSILLFVSIFNIIPYVSAQDNSNLDWVLLDRAQFDGNIALDTEGNVQLFWRLGNDTSTWGIASRSEGYLALGFSETGAMTGADIAVGYKNEAGTFVFENRNAAGFRTPQMSVDQGNNMRLIQGEQRDGVTAFTFEKRNEASCLQDQANVATDSWQWFIYAFAEDNTFAQHAPGHNGKKYVKLGNSQTVSVNEIRDIPGASNITILAPELTIPAQETSYCYTLHKMPEGRKNFILGERPASSSDLLHHLVIYSCWDLSEEMTNMVGQDPICDFENFSNPCTGFVTEWAPGMSGRTFEPGYGKPFGSDSYEYVMLETHYNNPELLEGQTDTAGYTFLYSDEAVDTEIGTLTLGALQVTGWTLEPGQDIVQYQQVCTPECTSQWPSDGVTAVSVFFHMHQRGRNQRVQIIRNGTEIPLLSSIRDFEYGYQFSKSIPDVQLLPGDKLITTCEFDTSADTQPVPGGLASKDEMCFAWVDYYPANGILACTQWQVPPGAAQQLGLGDIELPPVVGACLQANQSGLPFYPTPELNSSFTPLELGGGQCSAAEGSNAGESLPSGTQDGTAPSESSGAAVANGVSVGIVGAGAFGLAVFGLL